MTYYELDGILVPTADVGDKVRWLLLGALLPGFGTVLVWAVNRVRFGAYPLYRKMAVKWSLLGLCCAGTAYELLAEGPSALRPVWL